MLADRAWGTVEARAGCKARQMSKFRDQSRGQSRGMKRVGAGDKGQSVAEMMGPRAGMMWGPETSLGGGENKFM